MKSGAKSQSRSERILRKNRTPCENAHYEAFILQSSWSVGNLYASNLQLGQSYVKEVQAMERQRKAWLSRKEKEEEAIRKRLEKLQNMAKSCRYSVKCFEQDSCRVANRQQTIKAVTVGTNPRIKNLDKQDRSEVSMPKLRSISQPILAERFHPKVTRNSIDLECNFEKPANGGVSFLTRPRKLPRAQSESSVANLHKENHAFSSTTFFKPNPALRRTASSISPCVKFSRHCTTQYDEALATNSELMPMWLPTNMRSRKTRGESFL